MIYEPREITCRDGRSCILRSAAVSDANDLIRYLKVTAGETPFLIREPDEISLTPEQEEHFIEGIVKEPRELMLIGTVAGERSICKRIPQSEWELVERFVREFRMKQEPNPPMEALLGELKEQGYHLFLMSNTSHRFRAFSKNIPSVGYMDGIWISCECGYLKPEREAYVDFFLSLIHI